MQMCMMNIFVVCFLHASCSRLIQTVEVYINWYMMWYLKCRKHIFFNWCIIFLTVSQSSIFGRSVHHPLVWPSSVIHRTCSMWNLFVHSVCTLIFTIICAIILAIVCMIACTIFFVGPGFEPLALHHSLFGRSRVQIPDLAVWSFCGSMVQFPDPITCFGPIVTMAYVRYI